MNWLGEEQTFVIGRYAENKCHTYRPNWIQAWIDHDAAGVVVSVEALENDRSHPDFLTQQMMIDWAHSYFQQAGLTVTTRRGTLYTWRYRLNKQENWVPPAYDVSCYDDDHDSPVAVCLFYSRKDAGIQGADLQLTAHRVERTDAGRAFVMKGGMRHVHTPCCGSGEMHFVAVALYVEPPEDSWWTARW